jgi:hypothetical protein
MLSGTLSGLISGAAGAAGTRLLERFGELRGRTNADACVPVSPEDAAAAAAQMLEAVRGDEVLEGDLQRWLEEARRLVPGSVSVTNSVDGVVIGSSVVQTGISSMK